MRRILIGAALATLVFGSAQAQVSTVIGNTVCLKTIMVDRTKVENPNTITYYMKGGEVWTNTLSSPCTTLPHNGYIYTPTPPDNICGNLQRISVIQTGEVCQLGTFTPAPPDKPAQ